MGVHGLKRISGISSNTVPVDLVEGSKLCVDGEGFLFHIFKLSYRAHHKSVVEANSSQDQSRWLQSQLLLPQFTPLSLIHDVTTSFLTDLTLKHGLHVRIFFDGPHQFMKGRQRERRHDRRNEEWENVRQLCIHGILPATGPAKSRSSAARHQTNAADYNNDEAELFLSSFPYSQLAFHQIRRSIREFAHISGMLFRGSIELVNCVGEADVECAKSSTAESTYVLGNDTDYLIYGTRSKAVKYINFDDLNPKDNKLRGHVQTRREISNRIGLFHDEAMIELSILLGNDYTGPLLRHKDKEYFQSLRWLRGEICETFPVELMSEMQLFMDHIGERVTEGWRLTSTVSELQVAIEYSYALYSFEDVEPFRSRVSILNDSDNNGESLHLQKSTREEKKIIPSLPECFDEYVSRASLDLEEGEGLFEAATSAMVLYLSEVDDYFVEQKHVDALKITIETLMKIRGEFSGVPMDPPRNSIRWNDVQAVFILEKLIMRVINQGSSAYLPCKLFDHSLFLSCLESLSSNDTPSTKAHTSTVRGVANDNSTGLPSNKMVLPIDEHKETILGTIKTQRVTIIHGETGCGKSSRVPCFLLRAEPPQPSFAAPEVKIVISQPRRIAAKALAERVRNTEPDIAHKVALRMGHGLKEFETNKTKAWFVTTGYIVRLLANHPHWFDSHTHLIIDEVHERSVDSDILCLLCRRLLHTHPTIRLVLMSATLAANLYCQYFGAPQPIHVGLRRFPVNEYFVEDLERHLSLSRKHAQYAQEIHNECAKSRCSSAPPDAIKDRMYHLASQIAASVGKYGSSVLIFVAGMSDIESISELIERLNTSVTFRCFAIHSDIPFEEQMEAFKPPNEGEVKVIIATNAAESSVTLPDVDHVICLGLCKQIVYNKSSHRQQLIPTWISRASATQRAGRTGRVRRGNIYRLFSRDAFTEYFDHFEAGEMLRSPLDSVIMNLRDMMNEPVTKILQDCLEVPDLSTIERSFNSLHASNFISQPNDNGEITSLGRLVVKLGIDLKLGSLIGLGIKFGVAAESIELAAILSFPKAPWAISSPMYHDTATFNELGEFMFVLFFRCLFSTPKLNLIFLSVSETFASRCYYDAGVYSEPMAVSNLLFDYKSQNNRDEFCRANYLSILRMRQLSSTVKSLKNRVAESLGIRSSEVLDMNTPFYDMHGSKLAILRIIQVWLFHDTMMVLTPTFSCNQDKSFTISLEGAQIKYSHLEQILDPDTHAFQIDHCGKIVQQGSFDGSNLKSCRDDYMATFRLRSISYMLEKGVDLFFTFVGTTLSIAILSEAWESSKLLRDTIIGMMGEKINTVVFQGSTGAGNQRGVRGRACGAYYPQSVRYDASIPTQRVTILLGEKTKSDFSLFKKEAEIITSNSCYSIKNGVCTEIRETKKSVSFVITSFGDCHEISNIDLRDLFADPNIQSNTKVERLKQSITFASAADNNKCNYDANKCHLIADGPEGARLLRVLASQRRRDNFIRFQDGPDEIDINLPKALAINNKKRGWKRKSGNGTVYTPENSVCSSVLPIDRSVELFACCANTLELRGGACKVEGITLIPPGRLFCCLALLSFGINPKTCSPISILNLDYDEYVNADEKKDCALDNVTHEALRWLASSSNYVDNSSDAWRVKEALRFHIECMELGESLDCRPDKIQSLCTVFNMDVWKGFDTSLTEVNKSHRRNSSQYEGQQKKSLSNQTSNSDANLNSIQCPGCSESFSSTDSCKLHMESCCFGLVRGMDPIIRR